MSHKGRVFYIPYTGLISYKQITHKRRVFVVAAVAVVVVFFWRGIKFLRKEKYIIFNMGIGVPIRIESKN